jgi:hypothetical protein
MMPNNSLSLRHLQAKLSSSSSSNLPPISSSSSNPPRMATTTMMRSHLITTVTTTTMMEMEMERVETPERAQELVEKSQRSSESEKHLISVIFQKIP